MSKPHLQWSFRIAVAILSTVPTFCLIGYALKVKANAEQIVSRHAELRMRIDTLKVPQQKGPVERPVFLPFSPPPQR
jgi:hypothetical protein